MKSPLNLIISREYLQRVRRKSFIITTLLVPILMIGLMVAPALVAMLSTPEAKTIAVIDDTGAIFNRLNDSNEITFESYTQPLDSARANADVEAILAIGKNAVDQPNQSIPCTIASSDSKHRRICAATAERCHRSTAPRIIQHNEPAPDTR